MADDKRGREEQAAHQDRRQRERAVREALARGDEEEPARLDLDEQLGDLNEALEGHDYPTTTPELIDAFGSYDIDTPEGAESLEAVLSGTDSETFDSAEDVRIRILELVYLG